MHRTRAALVLSLSLVAGLAIPRPVLAQQEAAPAPAPPPAADPADVESIDAIIAALYDVISGPAGARDWDRFLSLFAPRATLSPMAPRADGSMPVRVIAPEEYVQFSGAYFQENPFYEREAGRELEQFGNVANAMSFYESRNAPEEEPFTRGVNTITLLHDGSRWYVLSIAWDEVREGLPAPVYGD
jgi:hypothetical protein